MAYSSPSAPRAQILTAFSLVIVLATTIRVLFFTGFFGSDETTYIDSAFGVYTGAWPAHEYIGAIRYGVNIPIAWSMMVFGPSETTAALWSLFTSVGEVGLVFIAGLMLWNLRAGILAALCLALLPLHAHYAGRIMADSPLAFFVSLSLFLTWLAVKQERTALYIAAGLAAGMVFWVKEVVFFLYAPTLFAYASVSRPKSRGWFWLVGATLLVIVANSLMFWRINDNPFQVFASTLQTMHRPNSAVRFESFENSPFFYFKYLFLDIRHTGLLVYLGLAGLLLAGRRLLQRQSPENFVAIWLIVLLGVLSFAPVRLSPLTFLPKQVNYMLLFAAPMALFAGYLLSRTGKAVLSLLIMGLVVSGITLTALEQQAIQVFTANSRATALLRERMPDAQIFGTTGALRAELYLRILEQAEPLHPMKSLKELDAHLAGEPVVTGEAPTLLAVMDPQTQGWGDPIDSQWQQRLASHCLGDPTPLIPAPLGSGRHVVALFWNLAATLPTDIANRVHSALASVATPKQAQIFPVRSTCTSPDTQSTEAAASPQ